MKYAKRYNKFNLQTNCRICLTQSVTKMTALTSSLKGPTTQSPLVYEALELVMTEKVNLNEKYPQEICAVCTQLLKISYDLKMQYSESQKNLRQQLQKLGELSDTEADTKQNKDTKPLVEIVVGSEKFNIQDLLIVEEEKDNEEEYEGFLNNLGKAITASFVKKGTKKPKPTAELPSLVIEKVGASETNLESQETSQTDKNNCLESNKTRYLQDMISNFEENDNIDEDGDEIFDDPPVNKDIAEKFIVLTENDKEVLESAMSMIYKCPYCQKPMSSLTKVKLHSRTCMKNDKDALCYVCGLVFKNRRFLLNHVKQMHLMELHKSQGRNESNEKHKCNECGKIFRSNGSLFYHMSKHLGRRYACDQCDKRFYTRSQANNHRQTHNRDDTRVVCPICGKGFHYSNGLFYHMKMHTNERNYQCSFCPRRFYTRNSIKRHELTHTGGRPYACNYCDKRFRSLGELKKHKLLHTGERPYQCKYCHLGFTQAHNLKMHLMTHPGEYQCGHCSKGFAEKEILSFHIRNKHHVSITTEGEVENQTEEEPDPLEYDEREENDMDDQYETIPENDMKLEDEEDNSTYFIAEEYETEDETSVAGGYEVRDDVLVETVEENLQ